MPDYLPRFTPGAAVTFTAVADITGGRLVELAGDRAVREATADSASVVGVAGFDVPAGERVTVFLRSTGVHPLLAASPVAAGVKVTSAAGGRVAAGGSNPVGVAITAAAANAVVDVLFI